MRSRFAACAYVVLLLLLLVGALPASASASVYDGGWIQLAPTPPEGPVDISFTDASHGWAVGGFYQKDPDTGFDHTVILATADGGLSWSRQYGNAYDLAGNPYAAALSAVHFVDSSHGWAVGLNDVGGGVILATSDGGVNWREQTDQRSGGIVRLADVDFVDPSHGWVVGGLLDGAGVGTILGTSDGGATWSQQSSGWNALLSVDFVDADHGWAVGGLGTILVTTDGGGTWTEQSSNTVSALTSVHFTDVDHGWAVGEGGTIVATSDGLHWGVESSGTTSALSSVDFSDSSHGWAVAQDGSVLATSDGGRTWSAQSSGTTNMLLGVDFIDATSDGLHWGAQSSGTTNMLLGVDFIDATHGWAVGQNGTFLGTSNGGYPSAPPTTVATPVGILGTNGWYVTDVTVTLSATDNAGGSGVKATYWKIGEGGQVNTYDANAKPLLTDGTQTLYYWSEDNAGNVETPLNTFTAQVDTVAPLTTATGLQTSATNWQKTSQSVTLSATDSLSGVAETYCVIDGGTAQPYAEPLTVSGDGSHIVTYWTVDNAGNEETHHTGYVNVDTQAPTTSVDYGGAWTNTAVTLHFVGTDTGSGTAFTQYSTNAKKWVTGTSYTVSAAGQTTVYYRSTDKLGTVEATKQVVVRIDTTAPSLKISTPKNKGSYSLGAVVLASWSASDTLSGVAVASGSVASGQAIDTSVTGTFTFTVTATDNAGNTTTKTVTYSVK